MKQLILDISSLPAPSFDNFVPGKNAELLQLLRDIACGSSVEHFVYLWGERGCGKTHLLKSTINAVVTGGGSAHYVACSASEKPELGYENTDFVAIDDVERLNEESQLALFNLYNEIRAGGGVMVVSAGEATTQLKMRKDLVTRLSWGLVYALHGLSDEEKAQALMGHARARGFQLTPDMTHYLLTHAQRDFPTLLATIDALDKFSLETKRPITLPLLREIMRTEASR
jgi:DnaA-homolog protein